MDAEIEHEEKVVESDTRIETPIEFPNEMEDSSIAVSGNNIEGVRAEAASPDQEESIKPPTELPLEKDGVNERHGVSSSTTEQEVEAKLSEVSEQPAPHEEAVDPQISSIDDYGLHRLQTPHTETTTLATEGEEVSSAGAADGEHIRSEAHTQLHQELWEDRAKALQRNNHLQARLFEYLRKNAEERPQEAELLQEYETCMSVLAGLRQQLDTELETVPQKAELLKSQTQEQLAKVESEWQALMALKHDVAVTVLSQSLDKQSAQEKVASTLAVEQLRHDQLIKARTKHNTLRAKIDKLEAKLRDKDQQERESRGVCFTQLQAERLKHKIHMEKQTEASLKLQKKLSSDLELLSNVKEKLYWSQTEVQAKREQLADVEAQVATKRDLLTRTKQAHDSLQRDNQRLKERRGLLGNKVLLQDFEDTVDAVDHLEEQLQNLKSRQAESVFSCGKSTNPETTL